MKLLAIVSAIALVLAGCGPSASFSFAGKWEGTRTLHPPKGTDPNLVEASSHVTLTIDQSGTFTLQDGLVPASGTFEVENGKALLTVTAAKGEPLDASKVPAPIQLTPQPDGSITYLDPGGFDKAGLTMKRVSPDGRPK